MDAAEEIGLSFGLSPLIIGVTIVAFGTSLPELAASIAGVLSGQSEIVIGSVVGSNVANICLVLGLVAVISKSIKMDFRVIDVDIPILFASAFFLWFVCRDNVVVWWEGIFMLLGLVLFLVNSFGSSEDETKEVSEKIKASPKAYTFLVIGGVLVWLSATFVVTAIQFLSAYAGVSPGIIAVTFVAIGTSLPEIVVSIAAARKGNPGIAIGNVIGSNIFNTFAVMGIPALISPLEISANVTEFTLPFMLVITTIFTIICVSSIISRWEGILFLVFYAYFMTELVVQTLAGM